MFSCLTLDVLTIGLGESVDKDAVSGPSTHGASDWSTKPYIYIPYALPDQAYFYIQIAMLV